MYRNTYAIINKDILKENIIKIKEAYPSYKYYIGVVKNDAYHHGLKIIDALIAGGINYLAVSSLDEAIAVRQINKTIPILCLQIIPITYIDKICQYNITITIDNLAYLNELLTKPISSIIKVHLAVDSGMNRLGFKKESDLKQAFSLIKNTKYLFLEGIYSHFSTSGIMDNYYDWQIKNFLKLTNQIPLQEIPIIHLGRSISLVTHEKPIFCNAIRLGIVMYGFNQSKHYPLTLKGKYQLWKIKKIRKKYHLSPCFITNNLDVKPAFSLYSEVISCRKVKKGEYVGYGKAYKVTKPGFIYTICLGYADGVDKKFQYVYINNEKNPIVADCMDMLLVFSQTKYEVGSKVEIFGQMRSIKEVLNTLNINAYHLFNQISNRVPRLYSKRKE